MGHSIRSNRSFQFIRFCHRIKAETTPNTEMTLIVDVDGIHKYHEHGALELKGNAHLYALKKTKVKQKPFRMYGKKFRVEDKSSAKGQYPMPNNK
jgi:hypothetical protein